MQWHSRRGQGGYTVPGTTTLGGFLEALENQKRFWEASEGVLKKGIQRLITLSRHVAWGLIGYRGHPMPPKASKGLLEASERHFWFLLKTKSAFWKHMRHQKVLLKFWMGVILFIGILFIHMWWGTKKTFVPLGVRCLSYATERKGQEMKMRVGRGRKSLQN